MITLKFIIDFFTDKSIVSTVVKSNILEIFQVSDEKCEKKFGDFLDLLMFIIDPKYDENTLANKKNYLYTIKDDIINYIQDSKLVINKPKVISQIKNNDLTQDIMLILAYIFDINILIHENNILTCIYFSVKFNKYRNTILLKVESDPTDGTEYYNLLIDNEQFLFNKTSKKFMELLEKEYKIPIGFIPNKNFEYNEDPQKLINDRKISEVFVNKQILEIKNSKDEVNNRYKNNKIDLESEIKLEDAEDNQDEIQMEAANSDSEGNNKMDLKYMQDYTTLQYNDGLESDDDQ
jgi:hypothetical protein